MKNEKYLKDIQDIKQMMSQSSQFISLSGLSGILAGIYALVGAFVVNIPDNPLREINCEDCDIICLMS